MRRRIVAVLGAAVLAGGCGPPEDGTAQELYRYYCARCHGRDGTGAPRARETNPGLDLTVSEMIRKGDRDEIRRRIADGHGTMPGFARRLSPEDLEKLVDYSLDLVPAVLEEDVPDI